MTAPTLPALLARLSELLPERVQAGQYGGYRYFQAFYLGNWHYVFWVDTPFAPDVTSDIGLEYALREGAEARGWEWELRRFPAGHILGEYRASICTALTASAWQAVTYAASPAEALAAALVKALEAEPRPLPAATPEESP